MFSGISFLCCGINKDRLESGTLPKYGYKADFNWISDLSQKEVLELLHELNVNISDSHIFNNIGYLNSAAAKQQQQHKKCYPEYINMDKRTTDGNIAIEPFMVPTTAYPMPPTVQQILVDFRKKQGFYDKTWATRFVNEKVQKVIAYCKNAGKWHLNIAVSGGIDSAVVLRMVHEVCKTEPHIKMTAILLPIQSTPEIQDRARHLCDKFGIPYVELELTQEHAELCSEIDAAIMQETPNTYVRGCAKSNLRGFVMYYLSKLTNGLIVGTGNEDEDAFLRFYSVYGDGYVDIDFIGDVPKHFMYLLGKYLAVNDNILNAMPSADLMVGTAINTDESEIGTDYTYAELLLYILRNPQNAANIIAQYTLTADDLNNLKNNLDKIVAVHERSAHKIVKPNNVFSEPIKGEQFPASIQDAYTILGIIAM